MRPEGFDFGGYATKFDLKCSDGRVIKHGAFSDQNGKKIPLVWNHQHNDPGNILGYGILEHRDDGEYVYGFFNKSEMAENAKVALQHGDYEGLSIWANKLKQKGSDVVHGVIREVSLVLAGANPGATIDVIMAHSEDNEDEEELFVFGNDCEINNNLSHAEEEDSTESESKEEETEENLSHAEEESKTETEKGDTNMSKERTVEDVLNEMTEEQQKVVAFLLTTAAGENDNESEEDKEMKHNVFDNEDNKAVISHSEFYNSMIAEAKSGKKSLKETFLAHADDEVSDDETPGYPTAGEPAPYGIENIDWLFPNTKLMNNPPDWIKRDTDWVQKVMQRVHKTPFSRIKSQFADITADEARAKGYTKGNRKISEVFTLLKRETTPTTIYKKQTLDRDDVVDITDFDVIVWIKGEMRMMLDEEIARAILIGDGRDGASNDKISELNIRPIMNDDPLFSVKVPVEFANGATEDVIAKATIKASIKSRKLYKGSGNPVFFTTTDALTDMLLLEDGIGRPLYDTVQKLATAMRVTEIIEVPVMEGVDATIKTYDAQGNVTSSTDYPLIGIIVNLNDYNVGADKGGAINMFDDFDIDFNQLKYLIETRCSGALIKPYSALVLYKKEAPSNP